MGKKSDGAKEETRLWDVVVVGGGPAGMMAAIVAAEDGAAVLLLEKNQGLGKKLLITGGGRCNVTNAEFDNKKLMAHYGESGKFLASPLSQWGVRDTLDFFHAEGMPTKVEAHGRVFPVSDDARSVWQVLADLLKKRRVVVRTRAVVTRLVAEQGAIGAVQLRGGEHVRAKAFIVATGGLSHPETGSTGDGYAWLRELGHSINDTGAALVPVALKHPEHIRHAVGVSIQDTKLTLIQGGEKRTQRRGKILFTHMGLSGPAILNMSREIGDMLGYGEVFIELDLLPESGYEKVNTALQELFKTHSNKLVRNALSELVPSGLVPVVLSLAQIDGKTPCHSVTRQARVALIQALKHCRFEVSHLLGMGKAVITSGGVSPKEVDFRTMRSHKYDNLYVVGDVIDIDRPSGGYSLQLCWTTGVVAGRHSHKKSATGGPGRVS